MLHTWSLSVEEQFYIFFPIFVYLVFKINKKNIFFLFIVIICLLSLFSSLYLSNLSQDANFFFTSSRIFEIGLGCLTANLEKSKTYLYYFKVYSKKLVSNFFTLISLIVIIYCFFIFDQQMNLPNIYTLIPLISCCVVILFNTNSNIVSLFLSNRIMVLIGKCSYSLYLFHFPMIVFFNHFGIEKLKFILVPIILLLSFISWKYYETPFRQKKISNKFFLLFVALSLIFFILIFINKNYIKTYLNYSVPPKYEKIINKASSDSKLVMQDGDCRIARKINEINDSEFIQKIEDCKKKYKNFIYIAGGSHNLDLYHSIYLNLKKEKFVVVNYSGGCAFYFKKNNNCDYEKIFKFIKNNSGDIKHFFYTQIGSDYLKQFYGLPVQEKYIEKLGLYLKRIKDLNINVIWFGPQPQPNIEMNYKVLKSLKSNNFNLFSQKYIDNVDISMSNVAIKNNLQYISKLKIINYNPQKDYFLNGNFTYSDTDHWSQLGEIYFGKQILSDEKFLEYFQSN